MTKNFTSLGRDDGLQAWASNGIPGQSESEEGLGDEIGFPGRVQVGECRNSLGRGVEGRNGSRGGRGRGLTAAPGRASRRGGGRSSAISGGSCRQTSQGGFGAVVATTSAGQRQRGAPSRATSDLEARCSDRSGRGGRSRGRSGGASSQARRVEDSTEDEVSFGGEVREKGLKGKNFSDEEEKQLTCSVLHISHDPIVGKGQKGSAFWERIFIHYNERRPFQFRPRRSLESKWGSIKHDVAKFIGVLRHCENLNQSGANASDVHKKALDLYMLKTTKNTKFAYMHVWEIVKDVPRCRHWSSGVTQDRTSARVMKRKTAPTDYDSTFFQPSSSSDGGGVEASTFTRACPHGSKHAKEDRRLTSMREFVALAQAIATKAMAEATLKKTQIIADANMLMLMTHSIDGVISDSAAKYLKLRQDEELEKLELCLSEARARKTSQHQSAAPISVETVEVLRRRVSEAMRTPLQRQEFRGSQSLVEDSDGEHSEGRNGRGGIDEDTWLPVGDEGIGVQGGGFQGQGVDLCGVGVDFLGLGSAGRGLGAGVTERRDDFDGHSGQGSPIEVDNLLCWETQGSGSRDHR